MGLPRDDHHQISGAVRYCLLLHVLCRSLTILQDRVHFGVNNEIVALAEIKGVKQNRARLLYEAKFRTVKDVALADVKAIAEAFIKGAALSCAILM